MIHLQWMSWIAFVYEFAQIAIHEVKTYVNNWWLVFSSLFVYNFVDVENVGMIQILKNLDLSECCDWKANVKIRFIVLHFLQSVYLPIFMFSGLVDRTIGTLPQLLIQEKFVFCVNQSALPLLRGYSLNGNRLGLHLIFIYYNWLIT